MQKLIIKNHGKESILAKALGKDIKGKISPILYILGIILSFYNIFISGGMYILVAIIWLIPDSRIEKALKENHNS